MIHFELVFVQNAGFGLRFLLSFFILAHGCSVALEPVLRPVSALNLPFCVLAKVQLDVFVWI